MTALHLQPKLRMSITYHFSLPKPPGVESLTSHSTFLSFFWPLSRALIARSPDLRLHLIAFLSARLYQAKSPYSFFDCLLVLFVYPYLMWMRRVVGLHHVRRVSAGYNVIAIGYVRSYFPLPEDSFHCPPHSIFRISSRKIVVYSL